MRFLLLLAGLFVTMVVARAEKPVVGVDANYALDMAAHGKEWRDRHGREVEPYAELARAGWGAIRIRLWVGDEGMNRLSYATETAKRAQKAGLKPYLVIFLSEDWADMVKQPEPAIWKGLAPEKKLAAIEAYAARVTKHFAEAGVAIDTYEIGNEIDFGICGVFEEEWPKRVSLEYMRAAIWSRMAPIIKAAQAGVLKENAQAKFILHLARWNEPEYAIAFWQAMREAGVRVDHPGLSFFPTSVETPRARQFSYLRAQADRIHTALKAPVMICETGYPSVAKFGGQFGHWNHAVDGYSLSEAGQAKWIAALVATVRQEPALAGVYYWSPEWFGGGIWDAFALWSGDGKPRPSLYVLKAKR